VGKKRKTLDTTFLHPRAQELQDFLEHRLKRQPRAIKSVVEAYNNFLSPVWENGPILALLAMGPSGSGKTYLLKLLAEFFLGDQKAITKVSCPSHNERHTLASLIGAPPGYIGYDEEPRLSQKRLEAPALKLAVEKYLKNDERAKKLRQEADNALRQVRLARRPEAKMALLMQYGQKESEYKSYVQLKLCDKPLFIFLLFDELEKGHEAIHHFLLEATDEGETRLANGEPVNLKHAFIVMTSNVGSDKIASIMQGSHGLGFFNGERNDATVTQKVGDDIYGVSIKEAEKVFRPEFLGRVQVVVYHPLDREGLDEIFGERISALTEHLASMGFPLALDIHAAVRDFIVTEATDHPKFGARLLNKKIEHHIGNPIARLIGSGQVTRDDDKLYLELVPAAGGKGKPSVIFKKDDRPPKAPPPLPEDPPAKPAEPAPKASSE